MELRSDRRVAIRIPVRIRFQDGTAGFGVATNISQGGIFLKTAAPWRSGPVDVRMEVPTPFRGQTLLVHGVVVRGSAACSEQLPDDEPAPGGIGVMFRDPDRRTQDVVGWLLSKTARTAPSAWYRWGSRPRVA